MVGDINLFLYPWEEDDAGEDAEDAEDFCVGEVDVMIASQDHRGKGIGKAAVTTFLHYICGNLSAILREYDTEGGARPNSDKGELRLKQFMVKIKADNAHSIALFKSLGFVQEGQVNFFGEIKMVLQGYAKALSVPIDGYGELEYHREVQG